MSNNQPPLQPTPATKFLVHTLYSLVIGILLAVLTAIGQYVSTAGDTIDFKIVASVGGAAFFAYLLSHFNSDIKPNWSQLSQGISDALSQSVQQSVQTAHAPLYNAVGQLSQQVAQVAQVVQAPPLPPAPQLLPISQMSTNVEIPAVITSQPWQPVDQSIHFGDSAIMPTVTLS